MTPTLGGGVFSTDQLSKVISDIRIAEKKKQDRGVSREPVQTEDERSASSLKPQQVTAKIYADQKIVEAECFKAMVMQPEGMYKHQLMVNELSNTATGCVPPVNVKAHEDDAKFYTSTSHIDDKTEGKICYGKFVEMDDIVPKKCNSSQQIEGEQFIEYREGHTYWAQKKDSAHKVDGIKKWNLAFRVYATIYSQANPHRASEMIQYVDTINSAAGTWSWENVAY